MADSPLSALKFGEGGNFIKSFPVKIRVLTADPLISLSKFGNTQYSFAVWSYDENRPMILSKGASITKAIQQINDDEDYGADVMAVDLKILASGEGKETRYSVQVLPKAQKLTSEQEDSVLELDGKLEKIIQNGVRASAFNSGTELPPVEAYEQEQLEDPFAA